MKIGRASSVIVHLGLAAGLALLTAGCNERDHKESGGGVQGADKHALFDRSSLNNEDNSLGVKSKYINDPNRNELDNPGSFRQLDSNNIHLTKTMRFAPELSRQVEKNSGIKQAVVLITESKAYVAVIPEGHDPDREAHPDVTAHSYTSKGGVGLFGTEKGQTQISWSDPGGLSYSDSHSVRQQILNMTQPTVDRVFVSANPNFVQRVRFYADEYRKGKDISVYMNEFNVMVQRVFPADNNTRK